MLLTVGSGVGVMLFLGGDDGEAGSEETASDLVEAEADPESSEDTSKEEPKEEGETEEAEDAASDKDAEGKEGPGDVEEKSDDAATDFGFGETFPLKTFNLNLGNALENRFVRLEITLEYTGGEKHKAEITKRLPQLRDAIIQVISRKTREFLLAPDGKDALRKEVLIRVNRYMSQKIESVYITDILIE